MADMTRFPVSTWQRMLNRQGARSVNCGVTGRFLRFGRPRGNVEYAPNRSGIAVEIAVMAPLENPDSDSRKICHLIVSLDQLKAMVATLEAEASEPT
jgi:hypothetical protein